MCHVVFVDNYILCNFAKFAFHLLTFSLRWSVSQEHMLGYPGDLRALRQIDEAICLQRRAAAMANSGEANRKF